MHLAPVMPIEFIEVNKQFIFSRGEDCVALGEYNEGDFYLMEDNDVDVFPNALNAFSHLNEKYRALR